jgi:Mrp family chromosome partitioning ATPase
LPSVWDGLTGARRPGEKTWAEPKERYPKAVCRKYVFTSTRLADIQLGEVVVGMAIIAVTGRKGGIGKSTITANLAAEMVGMGILSWFWMLTLKEAWWRGPASAMGYWQRF